MTPLELIKQIAAGERDFPMPMTLVMADGQRIDCEQVLRVLPYRRLVLRVRINAVIHILKLFSPDAARSARRERDNLQALANTSISHARLLTYSLFADGSALHIYQYIEAARAPTVADTDLLRATGQRLCEMLLSGWIQTDPHPDNFLCNRDGVWLIDAGSLQQRRADKNTVIESLGLWVAQFARWQQPAITSNLLLDWCALQANAGHAVIVTENDIAAAAVKAWKKRRAAYLKKIFRTCSEIATGKNGNQQWKLRREFDGPQLREFLHDPEAFMRAGRVLKSGKATSIVRFNLDGHEVVIKRYNYRGIWQGLKSLAGFGRARHNWWAAHLLRFCQIATPAPVAMLECRDGFAVTGYIVTIAVSGTEYLHAFDQRLPAEHEISLPLILLEQLRHCAIEHGDLKAKNLLLDGDRLWLIDLDSVRSDHWLWPWRSHKDEQRFLHNWSSRPALLHCFSQRLGSGIDLLAEKSDE